MKFTCSRSELIKAVNASDFVAGSGISHSVLSNVVLEAKDSMLHVKANNMSMAYKSFMEAKVEAEGAIAVSQSKLAWVLRETPGESLLVELTSDNNLLVTPEEEKRKTKAEIRGVPKDELPELPELPKELATLALEKSQFKKMVRKTIFAVSTASTQYTLSGLFMEYKESIFNLVGIDGRRLALHKAALGSSEHAEFDAIIPQEFLAHLQKILDGEGSLELAFVEERLFVKFDNVLLTTSVLDGKFPNYTMFIPSEHENELNLGTQDLVTAIGYVSPMADEETHRIILDVGNKALRIFVKNTDQGSTEETLDINYSGKPYMIGLNYKLISEILKQIETDEVELHFNNQLSPILVREKDRDEYFFIIMPMKIDAQ